MSHRPRLSPEAFYHIYNRGNNRENLFREQRNYDFFLERYRRHVSPIADMYAYCLMRNHFHFLIRIKPDAEWPDARTPERRFANFFNSYAKGYNKAYQRTGSLFQERFHRKEIQSQQQLETVLRYIHTNPKKHGVMDQFWNYPYSSYHLLLSDQPTALRREEVFSWFGSREGFIEAHLLEDQTSQVLETCEV
jgi:putative transposase